MGRSVFLLLALVALFPCTAEGAGPAAVQDLRAEHVERDGIVRISWKKVIDNSSSALLCTARSESCVGYHVCSPLAAHFHCAFGKPVQRSGRVCGGVQQMNAGQEETARLTCYLLCCTFLIHCILLSESLMV